MQLFLKFFRFTKRICNIGGIVCRSRMVRGFDILKSNIKSKFKQNGGKQNEQRKKGINQKIQGGY